MPALKARRALGDGRLHRGQATRMRLLMSAAEQFARIGFEGASLRLIAKNAGTAFQLVGYHFGSKDDLWNATVKHLFDSSLARIADRRIDSTASPEQQLRGFIREVITGGIQEPHLRPIVAHEYLDDSRRYHEIIKPLTRRLWESSVASVAKIPALSGRGALSAVEARVLLTGVFSANALLPYESGFLIGRPVKDPRSIQMQIDLLVSLLLHGRGPHLQGAGTGDSVWQKAAARSSKGVAQRIAWKPPAVNVDSPLRLLSSAIEVFARHGYHGVGLREIADHAGVAFQLVRYHFGSKPDLWLAVLMHLLEQQYESVHASSPHPGSDRGAQLETWVRRALHFAVEEPRLRRILTREYFSNSRHFMRVVRPRLDDFYRLLLDTYADMRRLGIIRHLSAEQAGILIQALVNPMTLQPFDVELTTGWPVSDPRSINLHVNLLVRLLSGGRYGTPNSRAARRRVPLAADVR